MIENYYFMRNTNRKSLTALALFLTMLVHGTAALATGPADETALRNAWALYTQQKFAAAADAFEKLIAASPPSARLYYYATLANRACYRNTRAKQLSQYMVTNFPAAPETGYAEKLFPELAAKASSTTASLPDPMKGKSIQELMKSEEGRKALQQAIADKEAAATAAALKVSPMVAKTAGVDAGAKCSSSSIENSMRGNRISCEYG